MITISINLKTESPNGSHRHWRAYSARRKKERRIVAAEWWALISAKRMEPATAVVRLTRVSAGELDDDNLRMALKAVRDEVANCLGFDDDSDPRLTWEYGQARGKRGKPAVRIEVDGYFRPLSDQHRTTRLERE